MRKQWKRLAAVLGGVLLLLAQNEVVPVKAAESSAPAAAVGGETGGATVRASQPAAVTNLEWSEEMNGQAVFYNPNRTAYIMVYLCDAEGNRLGEYEMGLLSRGTHTADLYHLIHETGTYTFEVAILRNNLDPILSGKSGEFEYTKPEIQLPVPAVNADREGQVTCSLSGESAGAGYILGTDYRFSGTLYALDSSGNYERVGVSRGSGNDGIIHFEDSVESGKVYYVRVQTSSLDITKYVDSELTDYIPLDPDTPGNSQEAEQNPDEEQNQEAEQNPDEGQNQETEQNPNEEQNSEADQDEEQWEPVTPDEMKRYAVCGGEKVVFTADGKNAYDVTVQNSVQGEKCFVSFEAVLGNYTIGRTYNIFPSGEAVYRKDSKARITLSIPETLQADNRKFRMISVTENGRPVVLEDLDSNSKTITFETDTYYAFALVYKDTVVSKAKAR